MNKKVLTLIVLSLFACAVGVSAAPTIDGTTFSPEDGATDVALNPTLSAEVNSTGNTTIYFMRNNGGTWTELGNVSTADGDNYKAELETSLDGYETEYTWTVNVSDTTGWVNSSEMTFTTVTASGHSVNIISGMMPLIFGMAFLAMILSALSKFMKF